MNKAIKNWKNIPVFASGVNKTESEKLTIGTAPITPADALALATNAFAVNLFCPNTNE